MWRCRYRWSLGPFFEKWFPSFIKTYKWTVQSFYQTTRQTHASRFCIIKFWRVLIRADDWHDLQWPWYTIEKIERYWFLKSYNYWFKSYLSNRLFRVNLETCYSDPSNITCGVPQRSNLGPLLFLIHVNMPQAVKLNLFLYADDSCLVYQGKDVLKGWKTIKRRFQKHLWMVYRR